MDYGNLESRHKNCSTYRKQSTVLGVEQLFSGSSKTFYNFKDLLKAKNLLEIVKSIKHKKFYMYRNQSTNIF